MKYELHITVPRKDAIRATEVGASLGWSTSHITDDPVLGPGEKFYLTRYDTNIEDAVKNLRKCQITLVRNHASVLRVKIEAIILDERP